MNNACSNHTEEGACLFPLFFYNYSVPYYLLYLFYFLIDHDDCFGYILDTSTAQQILTNIIMRQRTACVHSLP
jgi:hypothetical protein